MSLGPLDSFTVGRVLIRRRCGVWIGSAKIRNERMWTIQRTRSGAELWADRLMRETGTREWAGMFSPDVQTRSLCDEEATR